MRLRTLTISLVVVATVLLGVNVFAQDTGKLEGTVYLRSGQTLSGVIRIAELGVVPGSGIGTLLGQGGAFTVEVDGQDQTVPASDLKMMEASWANVGTEQDPSWKIEQITLTTKDGEKIAGKPTWLIHASEVSIEGQPAVHAFPLAGTDFSPDNFISKIVLGEPLPEEVPPPVEEPAAPAEEAPPAVEEAPPVAPEVPAEEEIYLPPPLVSEVVGNIIGEGDMSFTITCPDCGKKIRITITAQAVTEE